MDLFTHFIVPFILLFLMKSHRGLDAGLGGISLDFDFLLLFIGVLFPQFIVLSHRGITHSFIFGFVTIVIFLFILTRNPVQKAIFKIFKQDLNLKFSYKSILFAYFGVLIHLFLDFLTTGGIPLLYPFSLARFSGELYYYIDGITILTALLFMGIIFLRVDKVYKKTVLTLFIILLVSFGVIRTYEKNYALHEFESDLQGNFSQIEAYPTPDMFKWKVVLINPHDQVYALYEYHGLSKKKILKGNYKAIEIGKGDYRSAISAIEKAEQMEVVKNFRWSSIYTCIIVQYQDNHWKLTYFDFLESHSTRDNLTIYI